MDDRGVELRMGGKPEKPVRCAGTGSGEHISLHPACICSSQPLWDHKNPACSGFLPQPQVLAQPGAHANFGVINESRISSF